MSRDHPFDGEITSVGAFNEALTRLLQTAHRNGVEIEGGWECRNEGLIPDWEAVIAELAKNGGDD